MSTIPDFAALLAAAFAEDLGEAGDVTSAATVPAGARLNAVLAARDPIVLAGLPIAEAAFRHLDPAAGFTPLAADGDRLASGAILARISGDARALLAAERTALNFVQRLSGIATLTRAYGDAISGTGATLLDTRKTTPGWRALEKYAVRMGGGRNHRMGLFDAVLIKDNHIAVAGGVTEAVARARRAWAGPIEVEIDRIDQIEPALAAGADRLLLDNMEPNTLRQAVALIVGRVLTEASGGVRLETIRAIAETGVDLISAGRITQSAPAADIGLDFLD
ncbi:MAG: carboxylating nicotinate-nucleotide diphosphorylase [Sphingomonadaceae bacterium]|nr:carboxylating nicotinate-nucleotide diphosphorylase [Sphingomonadaceae bacterium]